MATADEYAAWIVKNQDKKGTPDFDIVAKAYQEAKSAAQATPIVQNRPSASEPPPTTQILTGAPLKAVGDIADVFINAPRNVYNLAKMGVGTLATAAGYPQAAPDVTPAPERVTALMRSRGYIAPEATMTPGQRVLSTGLQAATGGMLGGPTNVLRGGLLGGVSGVAGQTVTEATDNPVLGTLTAIATPAASATMAQARQAQVQAQQARNAVRDLTIRQAQQEGFVVTPGSVTPSTQNVLLERLAGKTRTQQEAASQNQQVTDRLSRRALNLPENAPLTRANMRDIRAQEYQRGYEPLNQIGPVRTDTQFQTALDDVLNAYTGPGRSFPNAIPQPVAELVQNYRLGQFNSADAVGATRTLREAARANMARGNNELGLAQRAISNALEDQIERSLAQANNPNAQAMLEQFRASRQRMAISHSVENAIVEGGGSVNARQLANDLQTRGRYFSGDLDLIARFANIARPVMTPPGTMGTPGAGTMFAPTVGGGIGAGTAALLNLGPAGASAGAVLGAMTPSAMSYAARNYLLSSMGQRRALPSYATNMPDAAALQNMLISTPVINNSFVSP
jgi:hypothetical protein